MTTRVSRAARAVRRPSRSGARGGFRRAFKNFLAFAFLLIECIVAVALVCVSVVLYKFSSELPGVDNITFEVKAPTATTIWSQDGVLLGKLDVVNRQPVTLKEVPKNVIGATVAIEDHRFYEHHGIDPQGIARAVWSNVTGGNLTGQGASTLTQQLVRNVDKFGLSREKRYSRKIREALYAMRVEQVYSKDEILQLYLNSIYYGSGAYGVQAAATTYFGKPALKLDLAEAALLAGLPQRPAAFSPYEHRKAALNRRDEVLDAMVRYGYCTPQQADHARNEKLRFAPRRDRRNFDLKAPYFTTYVLKGLFRHYGPDFVFSGLKIETTLNYRMQRAAERALEHGIERASGYGANQGALVCLENKTGFIRAMVGGRSFHADQFNAITQGRRQPGSSFKVFDYSAAFDTNTCDLNSAYRDVPIEYPNDPQHRVVKNYEGDYSYQRVDCLNAIAHSLNTVAVQVARDVGIHTVIDYAHKMGITTELAPYLPTALGASAVRPIDLCSAYSIFPNRGSRYTPMALIRVTDSESNVVEEHMPEVTPNLLKTETIDQMDQAFNAVVTFGTGTRARGDEASGIVDGARGKTGTTGDSRDTWFAGYTPELTTVVWVASAHRSRHGGALRYAGMPGATGGVLCAPIWHDYMLQAVPEERKMLVAEAPPPASVKAPPQAQPAATQPTEKTKERDRHHKPTLQTAALTAAGDASGGGVAGAELAPPSGDIAAASGATGTARPPAGAAPPATAPATAAPTGEIVPPDTAQPLRASTPPTIDPVRHTPVHIASARTAPRIAAPPELVSVTVCVDSGQRATEWCPATKTVQMTRAQARRLRRCHIHKAPPGEE